MNLHPHYLGMSVFDDHSRPVFACVEEHATLYDNGGSPYGTRDLITLSYEDLDGHRIAYLAFELEQLAKLFLDGLKGTASQTIHAFQPVHGHRTDATLGWIENDNVYTTVTVRVPEQGFAPLETMTIAYDDWMSHRYHVDVIERLSYDGVRSLFRDIEWMYETPRADLAWPYRS